MIISQSNFSLLF